MTLVSEKTDSRGVSTFCLQASLIQCDPANPCCNMDLNKVEIFMNNQCWGAVRNLTVNG